MSRNTYRQNPDTVTKSEGGTHTTPRRTLMTASYALHPWTCNGLGNAPFTLQQVIDLGSRKGTCDACGQTHLRWLYKVREAAGNLFEVGSSCIEKTDAGLHGEAVKAQRRHKANAKKEQKKRLERADYERRVDENRLRYGQPPIYGSKADYANFIG